MEFQWSDNMKKWQLTAGIFALAVFLSHGLCSAQSAEEKKAPANPLKDAYEQLLLPRIGNGEKWAIAYEDLTTNLRYSYHGFDSMQSASVIKVFIMGAVYEKICYPSEEEDAIAYTESYDGELRSLIERMITVSDNEAANALIDILGEGDTQKGKDVVNAFCQEHHYSRTHLGRKFLESAPTDDNYTSAADCRMILSQICRGELVNEEASEKMLSFLKGQTVRHKIPAGLPEGYTSANKTGEMPEGYGLGCIENDIAVIFGPDGKSFILTILSNDLGGRNDQAQQVIVQAAAMTVRAAAGQESE